jgi:tetratricopeptide (TPR) repeat protein
MSPEQLEGKTVDPRADVFGLGVVLHEALTGKLPYSSAEPNVLRREIVAGVKDVSAPDLPAELKRICRKALQRDPQQRHTSAAHFAAELRRSLGSRRPSRWPWVLPVVVLAVAVGAFLWWKYGQPVPVDQGAGEKTVTQQPPADPNKPPLTAAEWMALGRKDFDQNFFDRAAESYTQAVALDPNNAEAFAMRGRCKAQGGDFKGSVADFTKAIDLHPKHVDSYKHRALAYGALRQFDPAIADGEETLKLRPADPAPVKDLLARLYSNRAANYARAERHAEAAQDVTQAMRHDPKAAVYYHQRGSCYFNLKQYDKAAADFTGAIEREPSKASHYTHRGMCWQALGKMDEAIADFETAKKLGEK